MMVQDKDLFSFFSNELCFISDIINTDWQISILENSGYRSFYIDENRYISRDFSKWVEYRLFKFSRYGRNGIIKQSHYYTTIEEAQKNCDQLNENTRN